MHPALASRLPALTYPLYRRYWLASFASVGGSQLTALAQGWLVFELTGSAWHLGLLGAAIAVPNILMTLLGGVIADRFNKRFIMMGTSLLTALLLAVLAVLDSLDTIKLWQVLTIVSCISLVTGLDWPARVSIYPLLVGREAFMNAAALNAFIWQSSRMAIPAAGGLLIAAGGTWLLFALGAAGYLVMFFVMARMDVPHTRPGITSPFGQLLEGFRFIAGSPVFAPLLVVTFAGMFFCNAYTQLMPVFATAIGGDELVYGYLLAMGGFGSVLGTVIASGLQHHARLGWIMFGCAGTTALSTASFAWLAAAGMLWPALVAVWLAAVMSAMFMVTSMGVMQLTVPDPLRGRVMGIHAIGYSLGPLGGLFLGGLAEPLGPALAVSLGCGLFLIAIYGIGIRHPAIVNSSGHRLSPLERAGQLQENREKTSSLELP